MQAIRRDRYGSPDILELRDMPIPELTDDGMLVRVRTSSVNPVDWHLMRGEPFPVRMSEGLRRPRDGGLGVDVAGVVEAVGKDVTDFRRGDEVFGARNGAFAEYVMSRRRQFALKSASLTFEEAGAIPVAATTALQALRDLGGVRAGHKVLILGAGGGVGTFAVQIARALGAEVTAVTRTAALDTVASLGADRIIDYTREDFVANGLRHDVVVDISGNRSIASCRRAMTQAGTLVIVGGPPGRWLGPLPRVLTATVMRRLVRQRIVTFLARTNPADMIALKGMVDAGTLRPVIDRSYALAQVPEAIRYHETCQALGKLVITI